mgnify:CR=1 FL=1
MDIKDTTKKLPDDFGKQVMEFAKLTTDSYRNGSLQGQLKMLQELQIHIQHKIDELQKFGYNYVIMDQIWVNLGKF